MRSFSMAYTVQPRLQGALYLAQRVRDTGLRGKSTLKGPMTGNGGREREKINPGVEVENSRDYQQAKRNVNGIFDF